MAALSPLGLLGLLLLSSCSLLVLVYGYPPPVPMYFPDCVSGPLSGFPICNTSLPYETRAADLVKNMTVDEKFGWMGDTVHAIPRLGLPAYQWWEEGLHGLANCPGVTFDSTTPYATQFPEPLNSASSFNRSLWSLIGRAVADEARAFSNAFHTGMDYWTPNINIFRDPRWGRGRETPGEDPFHSAAYLTQMIEGLQQGEDKNYLKTLATCKHYTAYDMEDSDGTTRFRFNAIVTDQDMQDTFQVPFHACVAAGVHSMMCSFNAVNGVPMCANDYEINTIARGQWGFDGYITSDCGGIDGIGPDGHGYVNRTIDTIQAALAGGADLDCGGTFQGYGPNATRRGLVNESLIDQSLGRAFKGLLRTGWFDPPKQQYYRQIGLDHINTQHNQQLALEAAQQSIILLKNDKQLLPLPTGLPITIAMIGPNANDTTALWVSYAGVAPFWITPYQAAVAYGQAHDIHVLYAYGCDVNSQDTSGFKTALTIAAAADYVIFVGGTNNGVEGEAHDRRSLVLPGQQLNLIQQLEQVVRSPLIFVGFTGGPVDYTYMRDSPGIGALLWHGTPGQSGGTALVQALFGDYNPSGRLTVTVYPELYTTQCNITDMNMRPHDGTPGRTYRFYTGTPVYAFGTGLSYTNFTYTWYNSTDSKHTREQQQPLQTIPIIELARLMQRDETDNGHHPFLINVPVLLTQVNVTNVGIRAGQVSVLGFVSALSRSPSAPIQSLYSFDAVFVLPGQSALLTLELSLASLVTVDASGSEWLLPDDYVLFVQNDRQIERILRLTGEAVMIHPGRRGAKKAYEQMKARRIALAADTEVVSS